MAMEKDSVPSENNKTDVRFSPSSVVTQQRGEEDDSEFSDDVVVVEKRVESLHMKSIIIKKVKKPNSIRLFGVGIQGPSTDTGCNKTNSIRIFEVDIHVPTDTIVHNPAPLRCFDPKTAQFIQVEPLHDPSGQCGGDVENNEPQAMDEFSRILQNIEARLSVRPMSLCIKKLTKSNVSSNLNKLFITQSEKLMRFLIEEERRRVKDEDKNI
ncbi:calcium-dependent protein kinase 32-like [Dorcoceras hygrometricum]|nr:calcium-dependent protein kinase 32-like [Dorcoceras hygrometricum]